MEGRELRMRKITFKPGGVAKLHTHKQRPGIVYVLQGTLTDHRGGVAIQVRPGDTWIEDKDTKHWIENAETRPAVMIRADIVKKR